jgi:hypothetical protein
MPWVVLLPLMLLVLVIMLLMLLMLLMLFMLNAWQLGKAQSPGQQNLLPSAGCQSHPQHAAAPQLQAAEDAVPPQQVPRQNSPASRRRAEATGGRCPTSS